MSQQPSKPENAELKKWESEVHFFKRVKNDLLKDPKLRGKFIAIKDHKIIDRDRDEFKLAKRIQAQFPAQAVLIVKVEKEPPEYEITSPELQQ
jgi:hypothetical protein